MTVYLVFDNNYEGSFLDSVWSTEELANARAEERNKGKREENYSVEPYVVDSGAAA